MVKINTSGFLKASELNGETLATFVDEGKYVLSQFKDQNDQPRQNFNITVTIDGDEKIWTMNKTSQRSTADVYGSETSKWVGRSVLLNTVQVMVQGKLCDSVMCKASPDTPTVNVEPVVETQKEAWSE